MTALPEAASAEHLTDALRRCGALDAARVSNVEVASTRDTIVSRIIRLRLSYDGFPDQAPSSLILKTGHPDRTGSGWNAGRGEVAFYRQIGSDATARLVPRCFEAHWDGDQNAWHLLLEDLTDTHATPTVWPLPPTLEQCQLIMETRARFQAAWWDDPRLGTEIGSWADDDAITQHHQRLAGEVVRFFDRMGDRLSRERRELYEKLLAAAPRLTERYHTHRDITIVHGDAHVWNCFLPKAGMSDDVRLFDWDSWRIDVGSDDLAYMIAMHWYPDRRRQFERLLLDRHHETLTAHGVTYTRQALDDDYRLSVLWHTVTPVWQAANNIPAVIWWNNLERIFLAVDDLGCRDLIG